MLAVELSAEARMLSIKLHSIAMKAVDGKIARLPHDTRRRVEREIEQLVREIMESAAVGTLDALNEAVASA